MDAVHVIVQTIDSEGEEWEHGCTLDSKMRYLETPLGSIAVVDTPGSPELTRAAISGLAGADALVLVVDASEGPPTTAFSKLFAWRCGDNCLLLALNTTALVHIQTL
jgi:translation elongation factor EF-1alpha